jgi:exonuclease SbcD
VPGPGAIRYSGSLLKYSFGEAAQRKAVVVVDLDERPGVPPRVREVPLGPRRDLVRLRGTLAELLDDPAFEPARDAYVEATLVVPAGEYVLDAWGKLSRRFPHLRSIVQDVALSVRERPSLAERRDGRDDAALVRTFLEEVTGAPADPLSVELFLEALACADNPEAASSAGAGGEGA